MTYAKRVWFSNGIHHHYSTLKITPEFEEPYLKELNYNSSGTFPLDTGESLDKFFQRITPIIFDPKIDPKRINLDPNDDIVSSSANNYYDGLTKQEVE